MRIKSPMRPLLYEKMSLVELARRIVHFCDRAALSELWEHRFVFRVGNQRAGLLEYLKTLHERSRHWSGCHQETVLEETFDLTVSKFANLPRDINPSDEPEVSADAGSPRGPDCRNYFRAFLRMDAVRRKNPAMSPLQEEALAADVFQALLSKAFYLSMLECQRHVNPSVSRYVWHVDGARIYLWFPKAFPGRKRRAWLEANVPDLDPFRANEQKRIQEIIDSRLSKGRFVPLEENEDEAKDQRTRDLALSWAASHGISTRGMASAVAEEKAASIGEQRRAIRQLGAERLRRLVVEVFDALDSGEFNAAAIARRFGLSQASFSRFAATKRAAARNGSESPLADLWLNTARCLSQSNDFIEAIKEIGLWRRVESVRHVAERKAARRKRDD